MRENEIDIEFLFLFCSLFKSPECGNMFVEDGEECDCGLPGRCDNPCCNAHTCKLHVNATCATGDCCDTAVRKVYAASYKGIYFMSCNCFFLRRAAWKMQAPRADLLYRNATSQNFAQAKVNIAQWISISWMAPLAVKIKYAFCKFLNSRPVVYF